MELERERERGLQMIAHIPGRDLLESKEVKGTLVSSFQLFSYFLLTVLLVSPFPSLSIPLPTPLNQPTYLPSFLASSTSAHIFYTDNGPTPFPSSFPPLSSLFLLLLYFSSLLLPRYYTSRETTSSFQTTIPLNASAYLLTLNLHVS